MNPIWIPAFISTASSLITLVVARMYYQYLNKRDQRELERHKRASYFCCDAYYRGGVEGLRAMRETQVQLLRATAPEPRRPLIDQARRMPAFDPMQMLRPQPEERPRPAPQLRATNDSDDTER